ncbi:methyltransferase, FxLD system [Streptomyces chartreusis]|uniref:methyltransferase, FxLD system n=1 Tax=Streptomyces chartreusis TaxID=1969 RepID=UPI0035DEE660
MTRPTERPAVTTPATELDEASALRHQLADRLTAAGHIRTTAVEHAFRTVPRHLFAPAVPPEKAYANDIVATRHDSAGRITSSISAPWLQADMLEAARIQPGHQVLEIGSGGYNAALLAELVGDEGSVTTVDIDPAVAERATNLLTSTGYDRVRVVTADAEHLPPEVIPDTGFDAIIVAVDTWDLPWIHALTEGGRLVAPLRLHQYTWAISLTRHDGALRSDEPLIVCGFVAMQGAGARTPHRRAVPGTGVHLSWEDGAPQPVDQLAPALALPREPFVAHTHVTVRGQEPFDALTLYLAGVLPGFCRITADPDGNSTVLKPPPRHWPGAAIVRGASLAQLATERIADGDDGNGVYELVVHGYGPTGHLAAQEMAEQVQHWQRNHRAALCPRVTIQPAPDSSPVPDAWNPHVFVKKHTRITIDWPIVPGTAALLTDDQGRYLLHLRSANKPIWRPGHWALLGGNTEKGEHPDQAMVRELAEEIGLAVPDLTGFATLDTLDAGGSFKDRVRVYHGTLNTPAHEIDLREGVQLRWTRMEETAEMTMDPGAVAVLQAHQDAVRPSPDGMLPTLQVREPADQRSRSIVGAHLVLLRNGAVLLGKRHPNSAFAPSTWHLPAGHREDMEAAISCMVREAKEETGLDITEGDLSLVHVIDLLDPGSTVPRIHFFFAASRWEGEPTVCEPEHCTEWRWWPVDALPEPIVPYTRTALEAISRGALYAAMGWN